MLIRELVTPPPGAVAHSAPGEIFSGEAAGTGAPVPAVPDAPDMPLSRQMGKNLFEAFQISYKASSEIPPQTTRDNLQAPGDQASATSEGARGGSGQYGKHPQN